jgi:hypothetical protein
VGGCNKNGGGGQPNAAASGSPGLTAQPAPSGSTRLRAGKPPFSYAIGGGGTIRVVDATTNKQVAKTTVPPQSIIQIDSEKGVVMGTNTLAKGPLPSDHRYELWLDR